MAGDFASQKYLGSMEGVVLSGKLAAEVICDKAANRATKGIKPVHESVMSGDEPKASIGVKGNYPIAFGGGNRAVVQTSITHKNS